MRKFLIMACAAAIALTAVPAFAAVQNVRVSGWTDNTYIHRQELDLGRGSGGLDHQDVFTMQSGLQVDADLTDQVFATIALINERAWNNDNTTASSDIDLHLAYVTLKEMLYSPLTLIVGRQVFSFGNSLIFDATGSNNAAPGDSGLVGIAADRTKQTALDAIRAVFDYNPLTVTAFYSKLSHNSTTTVADVEDDLDIWGVNANYQLGDDMDSVVEAYFFKKRDKSGNVANTGAQTDYIKVVGIRGSTNPIEGLNLQGEVAHQGGLKNFGGADNRTRDAWAAQFIANYQVPFMEEYNPVTQYVYTKVTGGNHVPGSSDDKWTNWDPFFENQGGGHLYNALFNLTNMHIHALYLTVNPMEDVTARLGATGIWLDDNYTSNFISTTDANPFVTSPDGVARTYDVNPDNSFLGKELSLDLAYDYTEDVQIGTTLGYFWAGSVFNNENNSTAKQFIVNMNVAF
jgi:hypothetical protein